MTEGTGNMYMPVVPQGIAGNNGSFGFDGNNGWWTNCCQQNFNTCGCGM